MGWEKTPLVPPKPGVKAPGTVLPPSSRESITEEQVRARTRRFFGLKTTVLGTQGLSWPALHHVFLSLILYPSALPQSGVTQPLSPAQLRHWCLFAAHSSQKWHTGHGSDEEKLFHSGMQLQDSWWILPGRVHFVPFFFFFYFSKLS